VRHPHLHHVDVHLWRRPTLELIHSIETTSRDAGTPVSVWVRFRYCGEPGTPGPFAVRVTTRDTQPLPTLETQAALAGAVGELRAADNETATINA